MLDNDWGLTTYPFVPGHEVVGTIAALGAKVKELKIGQRVGLGWFSRSCSRRGSWGAILMALRRGCDLFLLRCFISKPSFIGHFGEI